MLAPEAMNKLAFLLFFLVIHPFEINAQTNINRIEYFIGNDPGFNAGIPLTGFTQQPDINSFIQTISPNLAIGMNLIGIRSMNDNFEWSHTNFISINVYDSIKSKVSNMEFFWDIDSGFNANTDTIFLTPQTDFQNVLLFVNVPISLGIGTHLLFVRSKNTKGQWSHTNYIDSLTVTGMENPEYFELKSGVQVFPNPFSGKINIQPNENQILRIMLHNIDGKKITDQLISGATTLETVNLTSGTYVFSVLTPDKKVHRTTLIKN